MYHKKPQNWAKHMDFIILDVVCLHLAYILAYLSRNGFTNPYGDRNYIGLMFIYTLVDITVLLLNNTLTGVLRRGFYKELVKTFKHICFVELIVTLYLFSVQQGDVFSRIVIYLLAIYYFAITYLVRLFWKRVLLSGNEHLQGPAIYFISTLDRAKSTIEYFISNDIDRHVVTGICILDRDCTGQTICGLPVTATEETVLKYLCDKWVDEVYISIPIGHPYPITLIDSLAEMGIVVHIEMEETNGHDWQKQVIEKIAGKTVRTISMTMATTMQLVLKRTLDIVGGVVGCIFTGILILVIGPMIYSKSPGPIFFAQTRVGKNGKKFKMYKFRSMYLDAEKRKEELMKDNRVKDGMMFKLDFDPRIIGAEKLPDGTIKKGIGNYIRDWSLDEFPQFLNVLKGELSLCGTRPPTVDEWEKYDLHHRARLAIKPGITGLWQVSGRSNITDFEKVVELDKKYIREWSMGLDFRILFQTIKVVIGKEGSM